MKKTIALTRTAVIAALYAVLTSLLYPVSFGPIQCRVSEALTILPLFYAEAVPGLTIGCFIANCFSGGLDMLFGTLATLLAAVLTYIVRKIYWGVIPPVICNAFIVPVIFLLAGDTADPYFINVLTVGAGEALAVAVGGVALYFAWRPLTKRHRFMAPTRLGDFRRIKARAAALNNKEERPADTAAAAEEREDISQE